MLVAQGVEVMIDSQDGYTPTPAVSHAILTHNRGRREHANRLGSSAYKRIDAPATPQQKEVLKRLSPDQVRASELAGEKIVAVLTAAPGKGAALGGLKLVTANGWFAARPSGTEDVYKMYAESFFDENHLEQILQEARAVVDAALA